MSVPEQVLDELAKAVAEAYLSNARDLIRQGITGEALAEKIWAMRYPLLLVAEVALREAWGDDAVDAIDEVARRADLISSASRRTS